MALLRHPWFDRVWVTQEAALARSIRVIYGRVEIPWQTFISGINSLRNPSLKVLLQWTDNSDVRESNISGIQNALIMGSFREKILNGQKPSFGPVLFDSYEFKATDPKDKAFGIQGVCSAASDSLILPDYHKPLRQVYIDAARYLLSHDEPLRLLSRAGMGYYFSESNEILKDLPSWVPDWSRTPNFISQASGIDISNMTMPQQETPNRISLYPRPLTR